MPKLFPADGDSCLELFATMYPRFFDFGHEWRVLEIGCAEADWLSRMHHVRPDLKLWGIDWRECQRPGAQVVIQGDVMVQDFGAETFEAVVMVSALEHIGLGHYSANGTGTDPKAVDGDIVTMQRIWEWLVPGGLVYFDVPWNPDPAYQVCGTSHRIYDDETIRTRFGGASWIKQPSRYVKMDATTDVLDRPTVAHQPFYYAAQVWQKPLAQADAAV